VRHYPLHVPLWTAWSDEAQTNISEYTCFMHTLAGLDNLRGKRGLVPISCGAECFEVGVTFLSVTPAEGLSTETDEFGFQDAITGSQFLMRFDPGVLIDGCNTRVVSGRYISRIDNLV
jgi:hypothetical protein